MLHHVTMFWYSVSSSAPLVSFKRVSVNINIPVISNHFVNFFIIVRFSSIVHTLSTKPKKFAVRIGNYILCASTDWAGWSSVAQNSSSFGLSSLNPPVLCLNKVIRSENKFLSVLQSYFNAFFDSAVNNIRNFPRSNCSVRMQAPN